MQIDAHQHFWRIDRGDYGWLTEESMPAIYRDFLPSDLEPHLAECGIDKTVLVQCAQSVAETRFLLDIAGRTPAVAAVVGWVDLLDDDAPDQIADLATDSYFVGLRPMLQDLPDDEWILQDALRPAIDAIVDQRLRFDALVFPRHLPAIFQFLERYTDLPVVIDHCAKPYIAEGNNAGWSDDMRKIANDTSAYCKLSGLATEAPQDWTDETLRPYVDTVLECFGPERIMWGSDWPVLTLAGDYKGWYGVTRQLTASLSREDQAAVFGGTAAQFYGIQGCRAGMSR